MSGRVEQPVKNPVEKYLNIIGMPLALIVFLAILFMPTPEGLTVQGQRALAVFWLAFILWLTTPIPVWLTSMLAIVLLALTGGWDYKQAFYRFGEEVIWLMVAAFIIASALERTGIGKRIAYKMAYTFGRKASTALLGLIILNVVLAFVVPSTTARAAIVLPIALLIAEAYGAKPGESRFGKLLMLQQPVANNLATAMILTATAPQIMAWGFLYTMAGVEIPWLTWLVAQAPIIIITMILMWIIGMKLWKPEVKEPLGGLEKLKEEMAKLGPLTRDEKSALAIFALVLFLWATDQWHTQIFFGLKIPFSVVAVIGAILLFMPKIGPLKSWKDAKVPWDLMIFSAGAYAVGIAISDTGAAQWMARKLISAAGLSEGVNPYIAYAILLGIMLYIHIIFSSKTVRTVIFIPLYIILAQSLGIPPVMIALPAAFVISWTISLPFNCKPNLIYYGTGYFNVTDELLYGLIVCTIGYVLYLTVGWAWFNFLGSIGFIPGWTG
ncbi:DASS family sodium-coupled anion symporter [Desulfurococcaceae archaeon MEX13E-LK6-19]|nr:DASS family sodium-coupled anion symporter [Desulfurococcaceae archaeon MEX13E-LK6-19]